MSGDLTQTTEDYDWQCPSCGALWGSDVPADCCEECHEKVVFPEDATNA